MKLTDEIVKEVLVNVSVNGRGTHFVAQCPYCERDDHLYVQKETTRRNSRGENVSFMWECKRCGENGKIRKLLSKLGKLHLVALGKDLDTTLPLENKIIRDQIDRIVDTEAPIKTPPLGWRRSKEDEYLRSRGFTDEQFDVYHVGRTSFLRQMRDYVIALVMEDGECKGYVGRSIKSREWIDNYNQSIKGDKTKPKHVRYRNSENTDFHKLLMGIDEIVVGETKTVIVVEGFFDKTNVDKLLELYRGSEVKCVCSFGKKISEAQIVKLRSRGVESVILLYDPDAVDASKKYSFELLNQFQQVLVGFTSKCDPGDLTLDELLVILDSLESPMNFNINKVQKRKL